MQEDTGNSNSIGVRFVIEDSLADSLPASTADGAARRRALERLSQINWSETPIVTYRTGGELLIVDREEGLQRGLQIAGDLAGKGFRSTLLISGIEPDCRDQSSRKLSTRGATVMAGVLTKLDGFMGCFSARFEGRPGEMDLQPPGPDAGDYFDLVLDLGDPPFLGREVPPPGYFAPGNNEAVRRTVLDELPGMTGEFGKPVYVNYRADICVHGGKGITGCTRCLATCPAEAIMDRGEKIEVNTSLCQGCGSCITACPTGALSSTWPPVDEWLTTVREILAAYRDAGGSRPALMVYDHRGLDALQEQAGDLPGNLIPVPVDEIGTIGMDAWLSMLAYGANSVAMLARPGTPASVTASLGSQLAVTRALLEGMGYSRERLRLIEDVGQDVLPFEPADSPGEPVPAAGFRPFEKQKTVRLALDHLYRHAPQQQASTALPEGAPFGEIRVDHATCTMCMSCVAICPVQALEHDSKQLKLGFLEINCVQCGLCRNACPEDSISLFPRYLYDEAPARRPRVLNEDEPFHCISCGKPFISRQMYIKGDGETRRQRQLEGEQGCCARVVADVR